MISNTEAYCVGDPQAMAIRQHLLDLERRAHATGWDGPDSRPRLFQLHNSRDRPEVHHEWCDMFTDMLLNFFATSDSNLGAAMHSLGQCSEDVATFMRTDLRLAGQSNEDLIGPANGRPLCGYGLRFEGWCASIYANDIKGQRLADENRLDEHPNRQEVRVVYFMTRGGVLWFVERRRGHQPTVVACLPEADIEHVGLIGHGLSQMVNAVVSNSVPLWPADSPRRPRPGSNPLFRQS